MTIVNLFLVTMYFGIINGINRKYSFQVSNVCYQQHNDVISDDNDVTSLTLCMAICIKNGCCSLLFDAVFQRCITYHVIKTTLATGCAWKYAEIGSDSCQDNTPYIPTAPNTCALGFSYHPSDNKCVLECAEYGTTFGTFHGFNIPALNDAIMPLDLHEECKVACLEAVTFVCRTADMSNGNCFMSVVTKPIGPYGVDSASTLWQRNCA